MTPWRSPRRTCRRRSSPSSRLARAYSKKKMAQHRAWQGHRDKVATSARRLRRSPRHLRTRRRGGPRPVPAQAPDADDDPSDRRVLRGKAEEGGGGCERGGADGRGRKAIVAERDDCRESKIPSELVARHSYSHSFVRNTRKALPLDPRVSSRVVTTSSKLFRVFCQEFREFARGVAHAFGDGRVLALFAPRLDRSHRRVPPVEEVRLDRPSDARPRLSQVFDHGVSHGVEPDFLVVRRSSSPPPASRASRRSRAR